jgi:hypothetical protein
MIVTGNKRSGRRREFVLREDFWWGQNPDLGVPTPRPPVEERGAAPQTPLHKGRFVGSLARFALVLNVIDLWVGFIDRVRCLIYISDIDLKSLTRWRSLSVRRHSRWLGCYSMEVTTRAIRYQLFKIFVQIRRSRDFRRRDW